MTKSIISLPHDRLYDVSCVGLNACDYLSLVPGFPQRGGKVETKVIEVCGGGQSATASCALARLGWRTVFSGVAGDDQAGLKARPWLEEFGVDPWGLVSKPGAASQQALILVEDPGGERTIIWSRDPGCWLQPDDLNPELIAAAKVLHLDGHFLQASLAAARIAREHGVLVSLDGERVYPGTEELVRLCDVVVGCQDFAQRLTGIQESRPALEKLAEMGPVWAGRTMGHDGAELLAGGQYYQQRAYQVPVVDTTGAGDVFHAGMVHAILLGQAPAQALDTASALAAVSVTGLGGRAALPSRRELDHFISERR